MPEVAIVDYGVGNLLSLKFALEKTGLIARIVSPTQELKDADAIALPGVGNFSAAAKALEPIKEQLVNIVNSGTPILGICLGLQLYFESSEEGPGQGLAFFKGKDIRLTGQVKIPHMGWNTIQKVKENELFDGVHDGAFVYFVHSLYPVPVDKEIICTKTEYSQIFTSAIAKQKHLRHTISPRKIRGRWIKNPKEFRPSHIKVSKVQVIPAIDLMNGKVVRLTRGDPNTAKIYDTIGTPVETAREWKKQGAERLHIIDLDATFGKPDNLKVVAEVSKATGLPIQVGGGIRSVETVENLLTNGIRYVILGALAFNDPPAIKRIQDKFGSDPIIVALDNKDGKVMVAGWKTETTFTMSKALEKYAKLGVKTFLITSIAKDGMLQGPDLENLKEACRYPHVSIIAAGGIGRLNDLLELKKIGASGAVVGKALYENRFTLKQAIKTVKGD